MIAAGLGAVSSIVEKTAVEVTVGGPVIITVQEPTATPVRPVVARPARAAPAVRTTSVTPSYYNAPSARPVTVAPKAPVVRRPAPPVARPASVATSPVGWHVQFLGRTTQDNK
jgi:hypothetical protein